MYRYNIGHIPGRPLGGRHGMVFGQIPAPPAAVGNPSVPLVPGAYRSQTTNKKYQKSFTAKILFVFI